MLLFIKPSIFLPVSAYGMECRPQPLSLILGHVEPSEPGIGVGCVVEAQDGDPARFYAQDHVQDAEQQG